MTRSAFTLLTSLMLLLQAVLGLPPARAMADLGPVAFCHAGPTPAPGPAPADVPAPHGCLACPICAAAVPLLVVPTPPKPPRSSRVAAVGWPEPSSPAPSRLRTPANLPTGPPRLA